MGNHDLFISSRLSQYPNAEQLMNRHQEVIRISQAKRCGVNAAIEIIQQQHTKTYGQVFQCVRDEIKILREVYRDVQATGGAAS